MKRAKRLGIPGTFAFFQALMPLIGWLCVHTALERFERFAGYVPWIAFALLVLLGGKMILEALRAPKNADGGTEQKRPGFGAIITQGIATSIDALSVGFAISEYDAPHALFCAAIIAAVTFILCVAGILIGRKAGTKLSGKAQILGGVILAAIGVEILLGGIL